jgi:hypothetical protein
MTLINTNCFRANSCNSWLKNQNQKSKIVKQWKEEKGAQSAQAQGAQLTEGGAVHWVWRVYPHPK